MAILCELSRKAWRFWIVRGLRRDGKGLNIINFSSDVLTVDMRASGSQTATSCWYIETGLPDLTRLSNPKRSCRNALQRDVTRSDPHALRRLRQWMIWNAGSNKSGKKLGGGKMGKKTIS